MCTMVPFATGPKEVLGLLMGPVGYTSIEALSSGGIFSIRLTSWRSKPGLSMEVTPHCHTFKERQANTTGSQQKTRASTSTSTPPKSTEIHQPMGLETLLINPLTNQIVHFHFESSVLSRCGRWLRGRWLRIVGPL